MGPFPLGCASAYNACGMADELLLAIETSGRIGSVGLAAGERLLGLRRLSADRRHTSELLPTIRDLLRENERRLADVDVLGYSAGPGSFTGLRVAATVGRMVQSAVGCRVVAVKVDNAPEAGPPIGIQDAELIIETPVEGGLTRLTAMFFETADVCRG